MSSGRQLPTFRKTLALPSFRSSSLGLKDPKFRETTAFMIIGTFTHRHSVTSEKNCIFFLSFLLIYLLLTYLLLTYLLTYCTYLLHTYFLLTDLLFTYLLTCLLYLLAYLRTYLLHLLTYLLTYFLPVSLSTSRFLAGNQSTKSQTMRCSLKME